MIRHSLLLLVGICLAWAGCSSQKTAPQPTSDCVRGEPEALLASQSEFTKSAPGEAREVVQTASRIKLTIRHFGCTHYALDFEFTWPEPRMPEPRVSLEEAAAVLDGLPLKQSYKPAFKSLTAAMRKMSEEPYKQPLTMSETETLTATTPSLNVLRVLYNVAL